MQFLVHPFVLQLCLLFLLQHFGGTLNILLTEWHVIIKIKDLIVSFGFEAEPPAVVVVFDSCCVSQQRVAHNRVIDHEDAPLDGG